MSSAKVNNPDFQFGLRLFGFRLLPRCAKRLCLREKQKYMVYWGRLRQYQASIYEELVSAIVFLFRKIKSIELRSLLALEAEAWVQFLVGSLPGMFGLIVRNFFMKLLCRKKLGFAWIQPRVTLVYTSKLILGSNVGINSGSYINAIGDITMGDFVLIGSNVTISSGQHPTGNREISIFESPVIPKPIVIEYGVWIGAGAVIMPGVTLRRGSVIGANSIVNKDTEPYGIYVGAPAKKIKSR
ncbi:MAG: hypothetical protein IPK04_06570 [Bdellovibrionales bacterium]|nr:hypothetical protein [Bdellovibrionales bacterium]